MLLLWNILSMSEAVLFAVPAALFFLTGAPRELGRLAALVGTMLAGEFVKHRLVDRAEHSSDRSARLALPAADDDGLPLSPRPASATDCNIFCNNGSQAGKPGMPSTHMAVAAAFATIYWPYSARVSVPLAISLIAYVVLMAAARYFKGCHTPAQILVGTVYGICVGLLVWKFEGAAAGAGM